MAKEIGGNPKINYKSYQPLKDSISQVAKQLPKKEPITLIAHSLGGIIAMAIALEQSHDIQKIITISSPFGGSKFALWAKWFISGLPVLNDLTPQSELMKRFKTETIIYPVLSVISTGGALPFTLEPNDSIVSVASQKALSYGKKIEVKANHFEVLQHAKTIDTIKKFLSEE